MCRYGLGLVVLAAVVAHSAGADRGASPDPKELAVSAADRAKAAELVRRLGSDEYRERELAERELAGMGRRARPALAAAAADPSPEVRVRVGRLLPKAEAADRKARLEAFAADADGKFDHDLPGWAAFARHAGADPAARGLFAELAAEPANLNLLAAAGGPKEAAGRAVADRRLGLYLQMYPQVANRFAGAAQVRSQPPTVADLAALLLAEVVVPGEEVARAGPAHYGTAGSFLNTPSAAVAVHSPDAKHGAVFRKLVGAWLDSRTAPDDLSSAVQVAQSLPQFPQAVPLFRRAVTTPGVHGYIRGQAIGLLVGRQGAEAVPFLRGLLADDTPATVVWLGNNPQGARQATCLVKDVALAALVLQGGETLKSYGFETPPGQPAGNHLNTLRGGGITFAFGTDEQRTAAFKKWAETDAARKAKEEKGKTDEKK